MKKIRLAVVIGFLFALWAIPAAAFTVISSPDAGYLGSTTLIGISGIPDTTSVGSITDGTQTVGFGTAMEKRTYPGSWATWSSSPFSENPGTVPLLYSAGATGVTMTLAQETTIFGFEAEPNPFSIHSMTASFYDDASFIGSITLTQVDGSGGARLFAASDPGGFDKVVFSTDVDFGSAFFRYAGAPTGVPEPTTLLLLGLGLIGAAAIKRKM